ncbi:MAG: hypothetical protein J2P21_29155 [Chloracidobacterium sp.]|nr:hypothetical protein [Chloracidobacterium sp.]
MGIKATPALRHCRTRLTAYGVPRGRLTRKKRVNGFQTGDMARATVVAGKKTGIHVGRVAVRASGLFNIQTVTGVAQGINAKRCKLIQRGHGYSYGYRSGDSSPALNAGVSRRKSDEFRILRQDQIPSEETLGLHGRIHLSK